MKSTQTQELLEKFRLDKPTNEYRIYRKNIQRKFPTKTGWRTICKHDRILVTCRECKGARFCQHNQYFRYCIECKGPGLCQHNKRKESCKDCKGSRICIHNKSRRICRECGNGVAFCQHNKRKTQCRDCNGSDYCSHNKRKTDCADCGGSARCIHGRFRSYCTECKGPGICEHGKRRPYCHECKGSMICPHDKIRVICFECDGSNICLSNKEPYNNICPTIGGRKYDGFCSHCFANIFPNDPRTANIRRHSKENQVVNAVSQHHEGFVHDKPLYVDLEGGCCASKRRIDLRKLIGNTILAIEVNENQHRSYDAVDERARYNDLFMDFTGKYIFILYNPDSFRIGKERYNPSFEERIPVLLEEIKKQILRIQAENNEDLVEIHTLFYDKDK